MPGINFLHTTDDFERLGERQCAALYAALQVTRVGALMRPVMVLAAVSDQRKRQTDGCNPGDGKG